MMDSQQKSSRVTHHFGGEDTTNGGPVRSVITNLDMGRIKWHLPGKVN